MQAYIISDLTKFKKAKRLYTPGKLSPTTIAKVAGIPIKVLKVWAADFKWDKQRNANIEKAERKLVRRVKMWLKAGKTFAEIAILLSTTEVKIKKVASLNGWKQTPKKKPLTAQTKSRVATIKTLLEQGATNYKIGKALSLDPSTIRDYIKRYNIKKIPLYFPFKQH